MIAEGKSVTDIAKELKLHPNTVSTYKQRIFDKTGFAKDADIIRYVIYTTLAHA